MLTKMRKKFTHMWNTSSPTKKDLLQTIIKLQSEQKNAKEREERLITHIEVLIEHINNFIRTNRFALLGVEKDKQGKVVIIYKDGDEEDIEIKLINIHTRAEHLKKEIGDFSCLCTYKKDTKLNTILYIDDFRSKKDEINKGYGSICMKYLQEIAIQENVKYIAGELSPADWGHINRLKHFYEKHGFEVEISEKKQIGLILWENPTFK